MSYREQVKQAHGQVMQGQALIKGHVKEVRCANCSRYLGENSSNGQLSGVFFCNYCKTKTEVR